MSNDPMDSVPRYNRVSIRAVLVEEGEDTHAALAAAGIYNPVAVPVVLGETPDLSGGILGDGITRNLTAVLETEYEEDFDTQPMAQQPDRSELRAAARPSELGTTTLPEAYGIKPLAPVRKADG